MEPPLPAHLCGISSALVATRRLDVHLLSSGDAGAIPVVFIHGNLSSATYFEELMVALPRQYRSLAVDLRGFGDTADRAIDATRGARDWADDLHALLNTLAIPSAHLVGWSLGAAVIMQFALDHPLAVKSLTLIAPVSPYGFGGSKDQQGSPCCDDFAGSGGGIVSPEFVTRLQAGDRSDDSAFSPRNVIRDSYFYKPPSLAREDALVDGSLKQKLGVQGYPGDSVTSPHWPFFSPGKFGPLNAISPKYYCLDQFATISPQPPVLWIRGDRDIIVDNHSRSDPAVLGQQALLPGWPGQASYPPQPMLEQTRDLLRRFRANGGKFQEVVMPNIGHCPFIEEQAGFLHLFLSFIRGK